MAIKVNGADLEYVASLDDKPIEAAAKRIQKQLQDLEKAGNKLNLTGTVSREVDMRNKLTTVLEKQAAAQRKLSEAIRVSTATLTTSPGLALAQAETNRLIAQGRLELQLLKIEEQQLVNQNKSTANSIKGVSLELANNRLEQQRLRAATKAAKQSQDVAVGSYKEAQQRLRQLGEQIRSVAGGFEATGRVQKARIAEYNQLNDSLKKFDAALGNHQRNVGNYKGALNGVGAELGGMVKGYLSAAAAIAAATAVFNQSLKSDAIKSSMEFTFGSVDLAEAKLEELLITANRLGVNYEALASSYKSFTGAVVASNFDFKEGERIFNAVAGAAARLKLSSEDTEGALRALQQMISKGNVQAEELRGQLGERLTGAFAIAARAMGVTETQLNKMLQKGEVLASDLLPKLSRELEKTFNLNTTEEIEGLSSSWQKLVNVFSGSVSENSNISGFFQNIINGITALTSGLAKLVNSSSWAEFWARLTTANGSGDAIRNIQQSFDRGNKAINSGSNVDLNDPKRTKVVYDELSLAYKNASNALNEYKKRVADGTLMDKGRVTVEGLTKVVTVLGAKLAQVSRFVPAEEKKTTTVATGKHKKTDAEKRAEAIRKIYKDLEKDLALIKLDPLLSNEEKDKKSIDAYNSAIKALTDKGINPASASIDILRDGILALRKDLNNIEGEEFAADTIRSTIDAQAQEHVQYLEKQKKALDDLEDSYRDLEATIDPDLLNFSTKSTDELAFDRRQKKLNKIKDKAFEIADGFYSVSDAVAGLDEGLANALNTVGNLANGVGNLAAGLATQNPAQILSGGLSIISEIAESNRAFREANRQVEQNVKDFYENARKGEIQYQELLRERAREQAEQNATNIKSIKEQYNLLMSQQKELDAMALDRFRQLQGGNFLASSEVVNRGMLGDKQEDDWQSLAGKTFEEIEQLNLQGKLRGWEKSVYDELVRLKEEGADVNRALGDLEKSINEVFTGTTADSLADSLMQMFKDGKTSAQDFADFFQSTMEDAAMSIFKNDVLKGLMGDFYKEFTSKARSGDKLTESEIAELQEYYKSLSEEAAAQFEGLKSVTGLDFSSSSATSSNSLKGSIQKDLTEQTGTVLAGYFAGFRLEQLKTNTILSGQGTLMQQQLEIAMVGLRTWQAIEANTRRTASNTENIEPYLKSIDSGVRDSFGVQLRAAGKYGY